jgi:hypothetical protein
MFPTAHGIFQHGVTEPESCSDADADAIVAAMTTPPDEALENLICRTVAALKAYDLWNKLDWLCIAAVHDSQAGTINWKSPGTRDLVLLNSWPHETDRGFGPGNGTNQYGNTNYAPDTHGSAYVTNNAFMAVYSLTDSNGVLADFGSRDASSTNVSHMYIAREAGPRYQMRINQNAGAGFANVPNSAGWRVTHRADSGVVTAIAEGVAFSTAEMESTGMPAQSMFFGAENSGGSAINVSTRRYAAAAVGGGMDYVDHRRLALIIRNFVQARGAPVGNPLPDTDTYSLWPTRRLSGNATGSLSIQGVAYDGTNYYASNATTIYKYSWDSSSNGYTLITSAAIAKPIAANQINSMNYYNGSLWVGCSNFPDTPKESWLLEINPSDLSVTNTWGLDDAHWSEGGAWRNVGDGDEWWNCYHDWDHVSRYKIVTGTLMKVDDYLLSYVDTETTSLYQGLTWHLAANGSQLMMGMTHSQRSDTENHIYRWTGSGFAEYAKSTPPYSGLGGSTWGVGQGNHWVEEGNVLLVSVRQSTSNGRIARVQYVPYPDIDVSI